MTAKPLPTQPQTLWRWLRRRFTAHPGLRRALLWWRALRLARHQRWLLGRRLSRAELGLLGELVAARWLSRNGRRVLHRNFRGLNRGEVDIVARHRQVLTFVEVKTRTSTAFGRPADAVNAEKQRLVQRGALDWLRLLGRPRVKLRFDIAEVVLVEGELPQVNVIENAFQLPESSMAGR